MDQMEERTVGRADGPIDIKRVKAGTGPPTKFGPLLTSKILNTRKNGANEDALAAGDSGNPFSLPKDVFSLKRKRGLQNVPICSMSPLLSPFKGRVGRGSGFSPTRSPMKSPSAKRFNPSSSGNQMTPTKRGNVGVGLMGSGTGRRVPAKSPFKSPHKVFHGSASIGSAKRKCLTPKKTPKTQPTRGRLSKAAAQSSANAQQTTPGNTTTPGRPDKPIRRQLDYQFDLVHQAAKTDEQYRQLLGEDANLDRPTESSGFLPLKLSQKCSQSELDTSSEKVSNKQFLGTDVVPVDWSLKSKLRVLSVKSLKWASNMSMNDDVVGLCRFVRCINLEACDTTSNANVSMGSETSTLPTLAAQLRQATNVWLHPSFHWVPSWPRIESNPSSTTSKGHPNRSTHVKIDPLTAQSFLAEWTRSLRSLYALVKTKHCPYFYVCALNFTCLFRASGVAGCDGLQALITPTTQGMRKQLRDAKVPFSTPLDPQISGKSSHETNSSQAMDIDDLASQSSGFVDDTESIASIDSPPSSIISGVGGAVGNNRSLNPTPRSSPTKTNANSLVEPPDLEDEESSTILESLGISQHIFPSLSHFSKNVHARKQIRQKSNLAEHKRTSLAFVTGPEATQKLINFLCVAEHTMPKSGLQADIPPTLISPVAFPHATLHPLELRVDDYGGDGGVTQWGLELSGGPIMPHTVLEISEIMRAALEGSYRLTLTTHFPTSPLSETSLLRKAYPNKASVISSFESFALASLKESGIGGPVLRSICSGASQATTLVQDLILADHKIVSLK